MPDYTQGKIYTIRSYKSDEVYVGSTIQTLANRMGGHRRDFKAYKKGTHSYVSSFEILKYGDSYIELVILNPCNSKTELDAVEGKYIREMTCVNKRIAGRTSKQHYIDNKVAINEYKNQKFKCSCGGKYTQANRQFHFKTKKHQLYITMEKMKQEKQKPKTKITDYYKPLVNSPVILVL